MKTVCALAIAGIAGSAMGQLDGMNVGAGLPLLAVQDTPTFFGDSSGADQGAPFGSELNAIYGTIEGGTLKLGITGNLEANFNKFWIFIDGVAGGEQTLAGDNSDGGFGEINNLGYTFDNGFEPDHGLRFELGGGFVGVNAFDLIDNSSSSVLAGGGTGDLPIVGASGSGVTVGWDNGNGAGVDGASAAGALTATQGWEIEIDLLAFLGEVPSSVGVSAIITNGGGDFTSNQVLGGIGGGDNLGARTGGDFANNDFNGIAGNQFVTVVPAPASAALLGLGGLVASRRRR